MQMNSKVRFARFAFLWFLTLLLGLNISCRTTAHYKKIKISSKTFSSSPIIEENLSFAKIYKRKYKKWISLFDERTKKFYENPNNKFDNGFFLSPVEEIPFKAINKSGYMNLPEDAAYIVEEFRGYIIAVSSNRELIYISDKRDFSEQTTVQIGEEIPLIKHYYLDEISENSLKFLLGHLKPNYKACRAFLEMYRITKKSLYLEPARRILLYLIDRTDENGLYRLPFPGIPLTYRAMYQSNILQLLFDYDLLFPEREGLFRLALEKMSRAFYFTDEGTRDHWLEATIGEVILDRLEIKKFNVKELIKNLNVLYGYIDQFDGKIPFCTTPCDPPRFSPNYQNYNSMLLAVLSAKYVQKDVGLRNVFPRIFEIAKINGDLRLFRGLYYAKLQFGFDDPQWARKREKYIKESDSFYEIPTLMKYKILR